MAAPCNTAHKTVHLIWNMKTPSACTIATKKMNENVMGECRRSRFNFRFWELMLIKKLAKHNTWWKSNVLSRMISCDLQTENKITVVPHLQTWPLNYTLGKEIYPYSPFGCRKEGAESHSFLYWLWSWRMRPFRKSLDILGWFHGLTAILVPRHSLSENRTWLLYYT